MAAHTKSIEQTDAPAPESPEERRARLLSNVAAVCVERGAAATPPTTTQSEPRSKAKSKSKTTPKSPTQFTNNSPISATTVHGKGAIYGGLAFFGMGVFIILITTGVIPTKEGPSDAPPWLIGTFGAIFAVPGLWLMLHGFLSLKVAARAKRALEEFPTQPWRADYPWNETGIRDRQGGGVRQMLFGMLFMLLFVSPFNFLAFESGSTTAMSYVFACVDGFAAIYVVAFFYRLARWMKFGTGRLQFQRFPFFLGEKLDVSYVPARNLKGIEKLTCTLRCVREAYETHGTGDDKRDSVVCYELHQETKELDAAAISGSFDRAVSIQFDLPENGETTRIAERPPIYWEMEIAADAPGVNLKSKFLLPIYTRSGNLTAAAPDPIPYNESDSVLGNVRRKMGR